MNRRQGKGGADAADRIQKAGGAVVPGAERQTNEIIPPPRTGLGDHRLLTHHPRLNGPVRGKFPGDPHALDQGDLIVGQEALLHRVQADLQALVAVQESRLNVTRAKLVAGFDRGVAARLDGGAQDQLLGIAEQVAMSPAKGERRPQVGGIGGADIDGMAFAFRHVDPQLQFPRRVQMVAGHHPHRGEHAEGGEVLAGFLDGGGTEALASPRQQPFAHEGLVHRAQAGEGDGAQRGARPGLDFEGDVQHGLITVQHRWRQRHGRERMARLAQRGQQTVPRRHHLGGTRVLAGGQAQGGAGLGRDRAGDGDLAKTEPRAALDRDHDRQRRRGGCCVDEADQSGVIERAAGDGDRDHAVIMTERAQYFLKPVAVVARPLHQREPAHRRLVAQGEQRGAVPHRGVQGGIAGGPRDEFVRLRIGGASRPWREKGKRQERPEDGHPAKGQETVHLDDMGWPCRMHSTGARI